MCKNLTDEQQSNVIVATTTDTLYLVPDALKCTTIPGILPGMAM